MTITYGSVRARITDAPATPTTQSVRLELTQKSVMSLEGAKHGITVRCFSGAIWLTQQRDIRDLLLVPGDEFTVQGKGLTVLQAIEDAIIAISENAGPNSAIL